MESTSSSPTDRSFREEGRMAGGWIEWIGVGRWGRNRLLQTLDAVPLGGVLWASADITASFERIYLAGQAGPLRDAPLNASSPPPLCLGAGLRGLRLEKVG